MEVNDVLFDTFIDLAVGGNTVSFVFEGPNL